jgi:hypothetical protein
MSRRYRPGAVPGAEISPKQLSVKAVLSTPLHPTLTALGTSLHAHSLPHRLRYTLTLDERAHSIPTHLSDPPDHQIHP